MGVTREGGNVVVTGEVAGSVFPTSEIDIVYPVLIDGSGGPTHVGGALYGRSIELRGDVVVKGPVVARGDMRLSPRDGRIQLGSGLTVNGSVNGLVDPPLVGRTLFEGIRNASVLIRGDVAINQNLALRDTIVFGSVRAVNCSLERSLVLGTCIVEEHLKVAMSTIGGYACRDVAFEGRCALIHAIGESRSQPLLLPFEEGDGSIVASDVRFYPALRNGQSLMNRGPADGKDHPNYSMLNLLSDWVEAAVSGNPALDEDGGKLLDKWVLSIGGRIADFSQIAAASAAMSKMLKCGFEFDHYAAGRRAHLLSGALEGLTDEEAWILGTVCGGAA